MMVSLTNHYNAIFIARLLSKTKIGKHSWYFNNSFLYKPDVSSAIKTFFFYQKYQYKTSTAAVELCHLKVEVADENVPNCSYVINRTCLYPMLIM